MRSAGLRATALVILPQRILLSAEIFRQALRVQLLTPWPRSLRRHGSRVAGDR